MVPLAIQPWMIKGGVIVGLFAATFYGGCRTQKSLDAAKIQRMKTDYTRAVGIIEVFQENYDVLDQAIKDNNAEIARQGEEFKRKEAAAKSANDAAKRQLIAANYAAEDRHLRETAELRSQMEGLSVGESCHEAFKAIAQ